MTGALSKLTAKKMKRIIKDAMAFNEIQETAIVAMLMPGHGIPLTHTCGAVLNHDMIRLEGFSLGWGAVAGTVRSEDHPQTPQAVSIPFGQIVWMAPEITEVK